MPLARRRSVTGCAEAQFTLRRKRRCRCDQFPRALRHHDPHGSFVYQANESQGLSLRIPLEGRQVVPPVAPDDEPEVDRGQREPQGESKATPGPGAVPPCTLQRSFGCVPSRKTSSNDFGHSSVTSIPVVGSIDAVTTPGVDGNGVSKYCDGRRRTKSAKIGSAAEEPERFRPRLSSNPTQTATRRRGEKPTNHASRPSFVVPVLPAKMPCAPSRRAEPPVPRSTTPRRTESRTETASASAPRTTGPSFDSMRRSAGVTRPSSAFGFTRNPPFANVQYAAATSIGLVSNDPSARDGYGFSGDEMPARRAVSTMSGRSVRPGAVSVTAIRTVGMLMDCSSAWRAVIVPRYSPS